MLGEVGNGPDPAAGSPYVPARRRVAWLASSPGGGGVTGELPRCPAGHPLWGSQLEAFPEGMNQLFAAC